MARRPGPNGRFVLSARERRLLGWVVALVLIIGVAVVVGLIGAGGEEPPVDADGSAPPSGSVPLEIAFGTALDPATGEVAAAARTDRFASGDAFAYSARPAGVIPTTVYVEVARTGGGTPEVVQAPDPGVGDQLLPEGATTIAFTVPAANLLTAFGPGEYRMRILYDPAGASVAEGDFVLVGDPVTVSPPPSGSP